MGETVPPNAQDLVFGGTFDPPHLGHVACPPGDEHTKLDKLCSALHMSFVRSSLYFRADRLGMVRSIWHLDGSMFLRGRPPVRYTNKTV